MAKSYTLKKEVKRRNKVPTDCRECFYAVRADYGLYHCNCIYVGRVAPQPNCLDNNIECVHAKLIMNKWKDGIS